MIALVLSASLLMQAQAAAAAAPPAACEVAPHVIDAPRPSYWTGFGWAAVPALLDIGSTEFCRARNPHCIELAGSRTGVLFAKVSAVLAQAELDRMYREQGRRGRVWLTRITGAVMQVLLSLNNVWHAKGGR